MASLDTDYIIVKEWDEMNVQITMTFIFTGFHTCLQ